MHGIFLGENSLRREERRLENQEGRPHKEVWSDAECTNGQTHETVKEVEKVLEALEGHKPRPIFVVLRESARVENRKVTLALFLAPGPQHTGMEVAPLDGSSHIYRDSDIYWVTPAALLGQFPAWTLCQQPGKGTDPTKALEELRPIREQGRY